MLESLHLKNVGPANEMRMDLAPRLNLITGDNGLGKTLLLDSAWWALTHTWPSTWGGKGIVPQKEGAVIEWREHQGGAKQGRYFFGDGSWTRSQGFLPASAPVELERLLQPASVAVYVRVDGGLSVYDPLRVGENFRSSLGQGALGTSSAFQFREAEIWDGLELRGERTSRVCEGLIRDVARWSVEPGNAEFEHLAGLVEQLAGEEPFRLTHKIGRVYIDDARDYPFLSGPGGEVPVAHAPAGLRRILALAYLVVWAWHEHRVAAVLKKRSPTRSIVLLVDEVESHLHPKWQRSILPSLLRGLTPDAELQIVATTHSPLVLASVEASFDPARDAWFDLDLDTTASPPTTKLEKRPYVRLGEVGNWLTSEAFDLAEPRSLEGERAVRAAHDVLSAKSPPIEQVEAADKQLREAGLPDIDAFWVRWSYFVEQARNAGASEKKP